MLWSFAIASNEDIQGLGFLLTPRVGGRAGHNVLHRLLHIGIRDWKAPDAEGGGYVLLCWLFAMEECWGMHSCSVLKGPMIRFVSNQYQWYCLY